MDRSLLHVLGCTHDEFARLAVASSTDGELETALQAYDPGLRRAREWSEMLPKRFWWFLMLLDFDDGYRAVPMHGVVRAVADTLAGLAKRFMPSGFTARKGKSS
jgi:hypothetical protein